MPLRDHFRGPLSRTTDPHELHSVWAVSLVQAINRVVTRGEFRAGPNVLIGVQVEADVAAYRHPPRGNGTHDGGGTATAVWAPPQAVSAEVTFVDPDIFEVRVYRQKDGARLVAVIELVSVANKDRPETRRAFAVKCGSYLQAGLSLVVVDVITSRTARTHSALADLLDFPPPLRWEPESHLAAVSYRTARRGEAVRLDMWPHALAVGSPLPTVPLWLAPDYVLPLDLEATYEAACDTLAIS